METVVHLIRHGTVHNPANVRYGRAPGFRLSALGRAQARDAAGRLRQLGAPIAALVSSPLERAVETAGVIAAELDLPAASIDDRLIEADSVFDGLHRWAVVQPWRWRVFRNPLIPSWGEPFVEVAERMQAALLDLRSRHPGAAIAVVSHQAPIWITRQSFELPGPPWLARVHCTQASVTSLRFEGERYLGHTYWAP